MEPAKTGDKLAHFRILSKLGQGGMGIVYKAHDEQLGRVVALKVLKPKAVAEKQRRARFLREARTAAAVSHPYIAAVHEVGEDGGVIFIAMEFIDGQTLRERMGGRALLLADALPLALEMAEGMARAHQAGIVHRDLKPDNVMVTTDGHVKILDFGLAKLHQAPSELADEDDDEAATQLRTREGLVFGTPGYMSPEQVRGQPVNPRSDIFAFGVILHELTTGGLPHVGATEMDTMASIMREPAPPPSSRDPSLPAELDFVTGKCLQKDPADRYQSCGDLIVDLRRLRRESEARTESRGQPARVSASRPVASIDQVTASIAPAAASAAPATASVAPAASAGRPPARRGLLAAGAVVAVGGALAWWFFGRTPRDPAPVLPAAVAPDAATPAEPARELSTRALTANPADRDVDVAAISPDGRLLAYVERNRVFVRILATDHAQALPLPAGVEPWDLSWFPDSTQMLITTLYEGRYVAWTAPILGGVPTRLRDGAQSATVSPDGKLIAYVDENGVAVTSVAGDRTWRVAPTDGLTGESDLVWSPDSRRLAYYVARQPSPAIVSADLLGGGPQVVVSDPRLIPSSSEPPFAWAADGRLIYGLRREGPHIGGQIDLFSVGVDLASGRALGPPRKLTSFEGFEVSSLTLTMDGRSLSYIRSQSQDDVYLLNLASDGKMVGAARRLTEDDRSERPLGWTSDASAVFFDSDRRGKRDIYITRLGGGPAEAVVAGPDDESGGRLSPDGQRLLFLKAVDPGGAAPVAWSVQSIALAGGSPTTLLETGPLPRSDWRPLAIDCGLGPQRGCVMSHQLTREIVFWHFDAATGLGTEITRGPAFAKRAYWDLDPAGERIALLGRGESVSVLPTGGGEAVNVPAPEGCLLQTVAWAHDGKSLLGSCRGAEPEPFRLVRLSLDGRVTPLWQTAGGWLFAPFPSPDGRHVAVGFRELDREVWLLEGL